ncbi:54S ribosomal protein L4, mitochondrial OS=Neosartorya fumigata (strain ATCC MYA-4609 / Af293 / CBS 101355 / FGSC A1100) GN=mrpl4 PE=3 SV=1 [Rhizoctonia solani AG-1 IB]|uniref:Large ribosomal subunit protein uL29m n=1 Tax=Thanatephorus cucumeris (strain AG1-IB / isolate 7/3/14) TaxID=1108050 RepID=A0A0B7FKM1_THACB|nr:54S ribosomal protein L4, mitochondrial OS=Neosartorya fumigata (strain ATCC MYA-4609 / Af293 / CBS 101355 / FGSC A1100) GN=mrpl4 PE=3 SV=1 [Rhizoctonia solani AG-1 IB]
MASRLLVSLRSLSLSVPRRSLIRGLATISDAPSTPASTSDNTPTAPSLTHQWQSRPARKLSAKRRAIPSRVSPPAETPEGHLRPSLEVEVNPNHGLYGFFRAVRDEVSGVTSYETIVPRHRVNDYSGRAWLASELRRKSFKDLHTLWYVLARERNLLATQVAEARRSNIEVPSFTNVKKSDLRCRKSMARIKQVLNERRLAYDDAVEMFKEGATPEPEPEPEPTPAEPKASLFEAESTPSLEAKPSS